MTLAIKGLDKKAATLAFAVGLATILGALGSQYIGGLFPCELCLQQRMAYYWGLPLLGATLVLWNRLPLTVWFVAMGLVTAIFVWSAYMGGYHAGVEWGFWPGPTACSGTGVSVDFNDLNNINSARIVPCDKVQFSLFGISMAGYNALISMGIVALLLAAIADQWRRTRRLRTA